jgi:hypothetical protein
VGLGGNPNPPSARYSAIGPGGTSTFQPEVVVLTRGRELKLEACPETLTLLKTHDVEVIVEETSVAISRYNDLAADNRRVAALTHSTC